MVVDNSKLIFIVYPGSCLVLIVHWLFSAGLLSHKHQWNWVWDYLANIFVNPVPLMQYVEYWHPQVCTETVVPQSGMILVYLIILYLSLNSSHSACSGGEISPSCGSLTLSQEESACIQNLRPADKNWVSILDYFHPWIEKKFMCVSSRNWFVGWPCIDLDIQIATDKPILIFLVLSYLCNYLCNSSEP